MTNFKKLLVGPILANCLLLAVSACTTGTATLQQGPDAEVTYDGLIRVDNAGWQNVWARPDFDISGYSKIMFEDAEISFRPVRSGSSLALRTSGQSEFPISEADQIRLREIVVEEFTEELSGITGLEFTDQEGPETLLLEISLLDIVSNVPPQSASRGEIYLSEVGSATLALELKDSESRAIMARVSDRRAAEQNTGELQYVSRAIAWSEVRQLAAHWGRLMRIRIDQMVEELRPQNATSSIRRPQVVAQ